MAIEHLAATDKPERIAEVLGRDGCCVVDQLVARERLDRMREELQPWLERAGTGRDDFSGRNTRRLGTLYFRLAQVAVTQQDWPEVRRRVAEARARLEPLWEASPTNQKVRDLLEALQEIESSIPEG